MQTVSRSNFTTVTTEGAILPADLLQRIADGQVGGLAPTDYHLAPNERLNEAINRSWNRLLGVWEGFEEQRQVLPDHDRGTTLTRERWLRILFDELGYGRIPFVGSLEASNQSSVNSIQSTDNQSLITDHRSLNTDPRYPISHAVAHIPIHLITFRQSLDRVDDDRGAQFRRSPHSLLQEFLNRSEQSLWGIVSNGLRLRLLRDNASFTRAAYLEFDLEAMFNGELYADFSLLWLIAHVSRLEIRDWRSDGDDDEAIENRQSKIVSPANCWLERWSQQAAEQGTRALDSLRDGVTDAIARLGRGFLAHPANGELRTHLQSGDLDKQDYFRQLLRLVYRLIFLFVAEDRNLLLLPDTPPEMRRRYADFYSASRLRDLAAARRSGPHPDLYRGLRLVLLKLREGYAPLGLPGLGGFLFSERSTPALDAADIANEALLDAIRALTFTIENGVRRPVDYKNLGAEELGSVYESLLELHPELNVPAAAFGLRTAAGSERKTTGSYYTPTSLINSLLDTALEPVVQDRLNAARQSPPGASPPGDKSPGYAAAPDEPGSATTEAATTEAAPQGRSDVARTFMSGRAAQEEAILNIKVVDPACGSGHFLIAAANRLARHLARIRTGDGEPSPEANRQALRDVVGRCIYGVDINEMSVELCKVALWMETLDPGKPLSFLDANIQCGNSLLGATPALLARGIPDEAFTPITGDDKAYCTEWKKRNREQRKGQLDMFARGMRPWERLGNFAQAMRALETMAGDTVADVARQQAEWERLVSSSDYEYGKLWADAWAAAFVWRKRPEGKVAADGRDGWPYPITEQVFREIERSPHTQPKWLKDEIQRLAAEYQFFHWHLAFPQVFTPVEGSEGVGNEGVGNEGVRDSPTPPLPHSPTPTGWEGGFDVVLGNPPWEHTELKEKEWFATRSPEIAEASTGAIRKRMIEKLRKDDPPLYAAFNEAKREHDGVSHFTRNSGLFPLMGQGRINTYQLFAELARHVQAAAGRVGVIVPSGVATDATTQFYFQDIMAKGALASLYDFENRNAIFPGVHRSYKFCLLTLTGPERPAAQGAEFVFFAQDVADLRDSERRFTLSAADIALLNPNTRTCPIFRSRRDAELTKAIYRRVPVLIKEGKQEENPWGVSFRQGLFNMTSDSGLFRTREQLEAAGWRLEGNRFVRHEGSEGVGSKGVGSKGVGSGETAVLSYLPLYEAKMLHHFNHRWATYEGFDTRDTTPAELDDPAFHVLSRYWVSKPEVDAKLENGRGWLIGFRDITNTTNERTAIFSVLAETAVGNNAPLALLPPELLHEGLFFAASLSSFAFDSVARHSVGGTHMNFFILKQLPVLPPETYYQPCPWLPTPIPHSPTPYSHWLLPRVLELTYTAYDLHPFAQDCGYHGPPFRWDEERRFLLRCELDAAYFHLYGIGREDVAYIMDTFPIVRRKDEAAHGEYRTKRVILEIYDEMAAAIVAADSNPRSSSQETRLGNRGYTTRLDPPPGHPDAAHPWDEAYLGPELPREEWWQPVDDGSPGAPGIDALPGPPGHKMSGLEAAPDESGLGASPRQGAPSNSPGTSSPGLRDSSPGGGDTDTSSGGGTSPGGQAVREPAPKFELKHPTPPESKGRPQGPKGTVNLPPSLTYDFTPPTGGRSQRLRRVMALGQPKNSQELQELVAALGDEDGNIRWLAGSSLARLGGMAVVRLLAAYLAADPGDVARAEAARVLDLIADMDEDEAVRNAARAAR